MDCQECGREIGSLDWPIFVLPDQETIVCSGCYLVSQDKRPDPSLAQFDPDLVSTGATLEYFKSLEN